MPLKSLSPLFRKKTLLLTHSGCDVDSLAAAAALYFSLKGVSRITIGVPDHMNLNAAALAKSLAIPFTINPSIWSFDVVVCIDFNEPEMLGPMKGPFMEFNGKKFLIDHHVPMRCRLALPANSLSDRTAISTTELVYDLLRAAKTKIPKKAFLCIACGIISDSASFVIADHETFYIMAEVMERAGAPYSKILSLFSVEKDFSEKVARLKAAKRCRIFRSGECVVAVSDIGAFEADAASALVKVGADVAFCGYADKGQVRISGRVNNYWMRKNGFDLASDVFAGLGSFFEGRGGGHAGAAGFNGSGDSVEGHLLKCVDLVHKFNVKKNGVSGQLKEYT